MKTISRQLTGRARSPHRAARDNTFVRLAGTPSPAAGPGLRAFSLIEVMASVAMLTVIIIGLVTMFGQTRRAFTVGLTQVDYLEAGRGAADLVARDLVQATPGYYANSPNFYVDLPRGFISLVQALPIPTDTFTNWINEIYFLTKYNQTWNGVGYQVVLSDGSGMIGTLYRYSAPNVTITNSLTLSLNLSNQAAVFTNHALFLPMDPSITTNRIIDGVVDFRVRLFNPNGQLLWPGNPPQIRGNLPTNSVLYTNISTGDIQFGSFTSNALPAYVEVELGVLEGRTYEHYRALTNNLPAAQNYLAAHAAQVHVFRQRVALRNFDPTAYP